MLESDLNRLEQQLTAMGNPGLNYRQAVQAKESFLLRSGTPDAKRLFALAEQLGKLKAEEKEIMVVDVKGAVVKPGVYEAQAGDRVIDIIQMAGGLLDNADQNQINFAMKVADEMVLYLPVIGEESNSNGEASTPNFSSFAGSSSDNGKVNLNTASESELQTLTGVGPAKAAAIIEYRNTNGPFKEIEQLKEISGIGDKTFEKLKEEITVR